MTGKLIEAARFALDPRPIIGVYWFCCAIGLLYIVREIPVILPKEPALLTETKE